MYIYIYIFIILFFVLLFIQKKTLENFKLWDEQKAESDAQRMFGGLFGGIASVIEGAARVFQPKIPGKKPCPNGMSDDGTSCWLNTYDNGVGTIPTLNPCPQGSNDVAGTCWYPGSGGCKTWWDGCASRAPGWMGGGCIGGAKTQCDPIKLPRVAKNIGDRGSSCGGKENVAGLCYNRCRPGYHFFGGNFCEPDGGPGIRVTAFQRYECPPPGSPKHTKLVGALCYMP